MRDFDLTPLDAAAVFGNAGYESLGFTELQEIKPVVRGSRGGYGWFQWTGPRRIAFEQYCKRNGYKPESHDANYKFLFTELTGPEKKALPALRAAPTLRDKVIAFEETFERSGVKAYDKRYEWAMFALTLLEDDEKEIVIDEHEEPIAPVPEPKHWWDFFRRFWNLITKGKWE